MCLFVCPVSNLLTILFIHPFNIVLTSSQVNEGYFESGEGMGSHSSKPQAQDVSVSVSFVERGGRTADVAYTRERFRQEGELEELLSQVPKKNAAGMAGVSRVGNKKRGASSSAPKDKSSKMVKSTTEKALKILEKSHRRLEASEAKMDLEAARAGQNEAFRNALEAKKALRDDPDDSFLKEMFAEAQKEYDAAKKKVKDLEESFAARESVAEGSSSDEDCCDDGDGDGNDDNEDDNLSSATGDDNGSVSTTPSLDGDGSVGDGSLNDIMDEGFELQG